MIYVLPKNPASPPISLSCLRSRARRCGYCIARDRYGETFSLINVGLHTIANVIEVVREHVKLLQKIG